jgi:hypothetical protein
LFNHAWIAKQLCYGWLIRPMSLPDAPANHELEFEMLAQPDDTTCGPTCLHAIYRYHGREVPLRQLIDEVPKLETGGTLGVLLALDALNRGYQATIYSYNLQIFDPTSNANWRFGLTSNFFVWAGGCSSSRSVGR